MTTYWGYSASFVPVVANEDRVLRAARDVTAADGDLGRHAAVFNKHAGRATLRSTTVPRVIALLSALLFLNLLHHH